MVTMIEALDIFVLVAVEVPSFVKNDYYCEAGS